MMRKLTANELKELDDYILRTDAGARQTGKVTNDMREYYQNRIVYTSEQRFVTPQELAERARVERNMETERAQLEAMERERAFNALTPAQQQAAEDEFVAVELLNLRVAKLEKARSRGQRLLVEKYEAEVEASRTKVQETTERREALNHSVKAVETLKSDPAYSYAVLSSRMNLDTMPRGSEDYTKNQVFIGMLERATPENYRNVVRDFHKFESDYYARLSAEKAAAGADKLAEIDPAMREANASNVAGAEAALKSAESLRRSEVAGGQE